MRQRFVREYQTYQCNALCHPTESSESWIGFELSSLCLVDTYAYLEISPS